MKAPETLRARAAQLVFPRLGSNMPPSTDAERDTDRFLELMTRCPVGGLVLFRGHAEKTPAALALLQAASPYPLLVASDLERGAGQQLRGASVFPHAMAFGHCGDSAPALVHHAAWLTAIEALRAGVHWLFAPVADVHSNPDNPIISTRAYSADPVVAADLVQAFISGAREAGALTTAKHFPGHGDTDTDSHAVLPVVSRDRATLDAVELVPFRAAFAAGVSSVMTAHVAYPALDSSGAPATFSSPILRDLLRDELGFNGVVVSDSLLMGGANEDGLAMSRRAPDLVRAGVDVLLDIADPVAAVDALVAAVESGSLDESCVEQAFQRVWAMKMGLLERFGMDFWQQPNRAIAAIPVDETSRVATAVAASGITKRPGPGAELLSGQASDGVDVIIIRPHTDYPDPTQAAAESIFEAQFPGATVHSIGPDSTDADLKRLLAAPRGVAVIALIVKPAAWRHYGLLPDQREFVDALVSRCPSVVVALGSPQVLDPYPQAAYRLCTYSDVATSVAAAAHCIADIL